MSSICMVSLMLTQNTHVNLYKFMLQVGERSRFYESEVFDYDREQFEEYEKSFPAREKGHSEMQDMFQLLIQLTY